MTNLEAGQVFISGAIPAQAALRGALNRMHALNVTLLGVRGAVGDDNGIQAVAELLAIAP